jgi:hypothetical protein
MKPSPVGRFIGLPSTRCLPFLPNLGRNYPHWQRPTVEAGRIEAERHTRLLMPLAFFPPRTLAAIIDGTGQHDATVTSLAQAVPYRWARNPAGQVSKQTPDDGRWGMARVELATKRL